MNDSVIKVLNFSRDANYDTQKYNNGQNTKYDNIIKKCKILSIIAAIFDSFGLSGHIVVKIILQSMRHEKND